MKNIIFIVSAAIFSSCSTAYKTGQTPDDVYYSPARVIEEDYREETERNDRYNRPYRERDIQMAIYDWRWRDFDDDYNFRYDPYRYAYSYGYYYNPYYCYYPVFISNVPVRNPKNTVPRMTNLGSYNNSNYSIVNTKIGTSTYQGNTRPYNNSNNVSNYIRRILNTPVSAPDNSTRSSSENSNRSYTPSSSSSSGSSSNSSGTPVSRPGRSR